MEWHFYDCIFSQLSLPRTIYSVGRAALSAAIRRGLHGTKRSQITLVYLPFLKHVLLALGRMLCIFPSVSFYVGVQQGRTADGGIATDPALILNTVQRRSCNLLNSSKDRKMG